MISIVSSRGSVYPQGGEAFSPAERFPESPFEDLSSRPNDAYAMVRGLLANAGLDRPRFGTAAWNPLGEHVRPGNSVFVLCNFVYHRRPQESIEDLHSKCVHGSVLRALIDYVLLAVGPKGRVRFGNAPLQSCEWSKVLDDTGATEVLGFYKRKGAPVEAVDLRLFVAERDFLGKVVRMERREESDAACEIDLGKESLLAELYRARGPAPRFRVSDYDPKRIEGFHAPGSHRYVIHRAILESDVVISLPKLKTHAKVGITCGLKGFVGAVAHKDCLAHYRALSPAEGGDEFPDRERRLGFASRYHDWVYGRRPDAVLQSGALVLERNLRRLLWRTRSTMGGSWHGNDTAWRMTLDLARIVHYADRTGSMRDDLQRKHLVVIDGILGGEGEGPLAPKPVKSGTLIYADDVALGDVAAARVMGYDPGRIPLIARAFSLSSHPISSHRGAGVDVMLDGRMVRDANVPPALSRPFDPPRGWTGCMETGA